jgi:hypothetical protein
MFRSVAACAFLLVAVALWPQPGRADEAGWHDIPCGEAVFQQPESYGGPIECRAGSTRGADISIGPTGTCAGRQYTMFYGRAVKGADTEQPAVHLAVYVIEGNTSRCFLRTVWGSGAENGIKGLGLAWAGGHDWMPMRKFKDGYAVQFIAKDDHRCLGFIKRWQNTATFSGVYCDPKGQVPSDQPYTDDEIATRVGVARLKD